MIDYNTETVILWACQRRDRCRLLLNDYSRPFVKSLKHLFLDTVLNEMIKIDVNHRLPVTTLLMSAIDRIDWPKVASELEIVLRDS